MYEQSLPGDLYCTGDLGQHSTLGQPPYNRQARTAIEIS